jgi:hypothetical protein
MRLVLFGEKFESGKWQQWKHQCDEVEVDAITDSAYVKAMEKANFGPPSPMDYLMGARSIFNISYSAEYGPIDGDIQVYALIVNQILVGFYDRFERHFALFTEFEAKLM